MNNLITIGIILFIVGMLAYKLYAVYKAKGAIAVFSELRELVFTLFLAAEEAKDKLGLKTGPERMAWVVVQFYKWVTPDALEKFIYPDTVENYLQDRFNEYKYLLGDYLDNGKIDNSKVFELDPRD